MTVFIAEWKTKSPHGASKEEWAHHTFAQVPHVHVRKVCSQVWLVGLEVLLPEVTTMKLIFLALSSI